MLRLTLTFLLTSTMMLSHAVNLTFNVDLRGHTRNGLFDPSTETIDVAGTFNNWGGTITQMSDADGDTIYTAIINGLTAGEGIAFKFRINGVWDGREEFPGAGNDRLLTVPDQDTTYEFVYNEIVPMGGGSVVKDVSHLDWWNDAVFYEIFVRSFYDSDGDGIGDFNGITQKLDYLNDGDPSTTDDLGITGIWLMPIHPSPSYHGYDVRDYRGINPDYGTMADFQNFLQEAHNRGIKVIIDYVMNHSSSDHPWFLDARTGSGSSKRSWYRWSNNNPGYNGPWGQQVWHPSPANNEYYYGVFFGGMPDLNYRSSAVRDEMKDIAKYWLDDIGVDGFRLDAVKFLYENNTVLENVQETYDFFQDFATFYKGVNPNAFTVGEAWTGTQEIIPYVENERLDYCFEFDLAGAILAAVNYESSNFLVQKMQEVYNVYPYLQFGTFLTNHDMDRLMNSVDQSDEKVKLSASLLMTLPGVPYLYYGEEVGMLGVKPDPSIRRPMQWTDETFAGFSTVFPWNSINSNYTTYNVQTLKSDPNSMWNRYRDLIRIRQKSEPLRRGDYEWVQTSTDKVYSFMRSWADDTVMVVINLIDQPSGNVTLFEEGEGKGPAQVYDYLSGDSTLMTIQPNDQRIHPPMGPYEVRIYRFQDLSVSNDQEIQPRLEIYPNPARDAIFINLPEGRLQPLSFEWMDLQGKLVKNGAVNPSSANLKLDTPQGAQGIYLLKLMIGNQVYTEKVILE